MDELSGKTAVVTGAASGIGRAIAGAAAAAGMRVVLADVEAVALDEAADEITATGVEAIAVHTDTTDREAVFALRDRALEAFGAVHLVCNNAGVGGVRGTVAGLDQKDWDWVLGVNLFGVLYGCQAFLPLLLEQGEGHVVNTASVAGHLSLPFMGPYNVSKHAVVTLSETIRHELTHEGSAVGISVLCPGFVATKLVDADRNRPEKFQRPLDVSPEAMKREREVARELMAARKPPAEVADLVIEAVRRDRFWVFTDEQFLAPMAERHRSIETAENPPRARTLVDYLLD